MVAPVVQRRRVGMRLFDDGAARIPLDLKETKRFASGIVILELEPAQE